MKNYAIRTEKNRVRYAENIKIKVIQIQKNYADIDNQIQIGFSNNDTKFDSCHFVVKLK